MVQQTIFSSAECAVFLVESTFMDFLTLLLSPLDFSSIFIIMTHFTTVLPLLPFLSLQSYLFSHFYHYSLTSSAISITTVLPLLPFLSLQSYIFCHFYHYSLTSSAISISALLAPSHFVLHCAPSFSNFLHLLLIWNNNQNSFIFVCITYRVYQGMKMLTSVNDAFVQFLQYPIIGWMSKDLGLGYTHLYCLKRVQRIHQHLSQGS